MVAPGPRSGADPRARLMDALPLLPLAVLLLAFPLFRSASPLLAYTSGERLGVGALELSFVGLCLLQLALGRARAGASCLPLALAWRLAPGWGLALLVAWWGWGTVAASLVERPEAALLRQAEWGLHAVFAWVLWAYLLARPRQRPRVALALPLGFGVWIAWLCVYGWMLADPFSHDWANELPGFHNIRHADYYACAAVMALATLRLDRRSPLDVGIALVVFWAVTVWTGSRGVLLAIAAATGAIALARLDRGWWWRCVGLAGTGLLGALLSRPFRVESSFLGLEYAIGRSVAGLTSAGSAGQKLTQTTAGRWQGWSRSLLEVRDHPWLGLGPDGFSFLPTSSIQPHNLFLQTALEWGIPGALLFGLLLASLVMGALFGIRRHGAGMAASRLTGLAVVLGLTAYSAVDGTYYSAFPLSLIACGIALALQPSSGAHEPARGRWAALCAAAIAGTAGLVLALHAAVVMALASDPVPKPDAPEARLVRVFPTRVESALHAGGVLFWAIDWSEHDPETAIEWLHWSHHYARRPWAHYQLEARLLWQAGRRRDALDHVAAAARVAALSGQLLKSRALERAMKGR